MRVVMTEKADGLTVEKQIVYQAAAGEGLFKVEVLAVLCGKDLSLTISGGEKHHIGAVALAVPRPSLSDPQKISSSASVLTVVSHKEDELARQVALMLAASLNCTVTAAVGIHIDNAAEKDIGVLSANCFAALKEITAKLQS